MHIATYRITLSGKTYEVQIRRTDDHTVFEVEVDGKKHSVKLPQTAQTQTAKANPKIAPKTNPNAVTAQMPGQIVEVNVKNGAKVKIGDTLIVLNSMKMNITITAPRAGTVTELNLKPGDSVNKAQMLLKIN